MGSLMLKAWRKSCRRPYQHFKAAKDQCDAFNGGEKPFCARLRGGRVGFWGLSSDFSQPRRAIDSFTVSPRTPVLGSSAPRLLHVREGRRHARSCWRAPSLRRRGFNVEQIKQCAFVGACFFRPLPSGATPAWSVPLRGFLQTAHAYVWPRGWDVIAASNMKSSLAWFCRPITALHRAALGCTSWSDRDWLAKVSA